MTRLRKMMLEELAASPTIPRARRDVICVTSSGSHNTLASHRTSSAPITFAPIRVICSR